MAGEIVVRAQHGLGTVYGIISNANGQPWNTGTVAFEAWNDANYANYAALTFVEQGSSGRYANTTNIPAGITVRAILTVDVLQQTGSTPTEGSDQPMGFGSLNWNGAAEQGPAALLLDGSGHATTDISSRITTAVPNVAAGASGGLPLLGETTQVLSTADLTAIATKLLAAPGMPILNNSSTGKVALDDRQAPDVSVAGSIGQWLAAAAAKGSAFSIIGNQLVFTLPGGTHTVTITANNALAPTSASAVVA